MVPRESLVKWSSCEEATFITAEVPGLNGTAPEQSTDRSLIHHPPLLLDRRPSFIISRLFSFYLHCVKNVELGNKYYSF